MVFDRLQFAFNGRIPMDLFKSIESDFNNIFYQVMFHDYEKNERLRIQCDGTSPVGSVTITGDHAEWVDINIQFLNIRATAYTRQCVNELSPSDLKEWLSRRSIILTTIGDIPAYMFRITIMIVVYGTISCMALCSPTHFTQQVPTEVIAPRGGKGLDFVIYCDVTKKPDDIDVMGLVFGKKGTKANDLTISNKFNRFDCLVYFRDGQKQKMKIVCWKPDEFDFGGNRNSLDGDIIRYLNRDDIALKKIHAVVDVGVGIKVDRIIVRNHSQTLFEIGKDKVDIV